MPIELDDYHIDFVQTNGAYMKLRKSKEHGFTAKDFQDVQLKMIQSNKIPRLVPIRFEEMNGETSIYYRIEGLRRLRAIAKERPMSMQDYYSLFINIVQALQDATNNLLNEDRYVLHEDFIYIGNSYYQVYLTYLPLKDMNSTTTLNESLKKLLLNMASEVQGIHGGQFKMILSYIKDPGFSLVGLKKLLQDLQGKQSVIETESESEPPAAEYGLNNEQEEVTVMKKVKKLPPLPRKMKLYTILFGIILIAISWKLADGGASNMIIVSSILSVIIIVGVITYLFFWRPGVEPIITEKAVTVKRPKRQPAKKTAPKNPAVSHTAQPDTEGTEQTLSNFDFNDIEASEENTVKPSFGEQQSYKQENEHHQAAVATIPVKKKPQTTHSNYEELVTLNNAQAAPTLTKANETVTDIELDITLASNIRDQTVLLDEEELLAGSSKRVKNYLIAETNGHEEIEITAENIIIGRSEKGAHLVDKAVGISRMHVEFVKLSDTYGVKDLGSKNGTFLNNKRLIPYKIHEMNSGDKVQIGKSIYTYKVLE